MSAYNWLNSALHPVAEKAAEMFKQEHGATHVVREEPIEEDIQYRPTIQARLRDCHTLCVEVTDGSYTESLDAFIIDCQHRGLPVKLYLAIPSEADATRFKELVQKARSRGVGVVAVGKTKCELLFPAVSLSLAGLRRLRVADFPKAYRQAVSEAQDTFLNGDPSKACSRLFDELERVTRTLAVRIDKKALWKSKAQRKAKNLETDSWQTVLKDIRDCANLGALPRGKPALNETLISRVIGVTGHRNESSHKPKDRKALLKRDRELRTRFESTADLLLDVLGAVKPMRL